jgi:hypothetical protein
MSKTCAVNFHFASGDLRKNKVDFTIGVKYTPKLQFWTDLSLIYTESYQFLISL